MNVVKNPLRKAKILLVDDDQALLRLLTMRLESRGFEVITAFDGKEGLSKVDFINPDLVVTDLRMDQMDGMEFFRAARKQAPYLPFIVMTAHGTIPDAVKATQEGVYSYITKPIDKEVFMKAVEEALELSWGSDLETPLQEEGPFTDHIITRNPAMIEIIQKAKLITDSDVKILITGDNGTGKELLAKTIHEASHRSDGPFVAINCSVLNEHSLIHEVLPKAQGGTLFLNEITDIPLPLQVTLMGLIKDFEAQSELDKGVRFISSSVSDLKDTMQKKKFREDLYYALSVVSFGLPKLVERKEDIPLLARYFLKNIAARQKSSVQEFSPEAMKIIADAKWPGNIRQLYHVVEQLVALSTTPIIPQTLAEKAIDDSSIPIIPFAEARSHFERDYLVRLLKMTEGNVSHAARIAKRNRTDFYKLLARNNIEPQSLKRSLFRPQLEG